MRLYGALLQLPLIPAALLLLISAVTVALQAGKGITLRNTNSIDFLIKHFSAAKNSVIKTKHLTAANVLA